MPYLNEGQIMPNSYFIEKRASLRFPVNIPLSYFELDSCKTANAQTYDISAEGMGIETHRELPLGICLDIYLQMLDNGEQIYKQGKVVWSTTTDSGKYRVGIKLEEPRLKPIPIVLRTIKAQRNY